MILEPLADKIVVKRDEPKNKSDGGILLPDTGKQKSQQGKVVAVGPGKFGEDGYRVEPSVEVGDVVLLSLYGGCEVTVDGEDYLVVREDEILCVIKK